jgi:hypothetical protein
MSNWRLQSLELLWRPGIILQYLCLFTLPLGFAVWVQWIRNSPTMLRSRGFVRSCIGIAVTLGLSIVIGLISHKGVALPSIPWNLEELGDLWRPARLLLTGIVLILTVPYTASWITGIGADFSAPNREVTAVLFHVTMLSLLPLTLAYQQFGDEYLLVFVPWVAWIIMRWLPLRRPTVISLAAIAMLQLAVVTVWLDDILSRNQVQWQSARNAVERLHISPTSISAGWTWAAYNSFDEYLERHPSSGQVDFRSLFDEWLPTYRDRAAYRVEVSDHCTTSPLGDATLVRRRMLLGRVVEARAQHVR